MRIPRGFIQLVIGIAVLLWLLQLADTMKVLASISTVDPYYLAIREQFKLATNV